jgi:hypothetical protein
MDETSVRRLLDGALAGEPPMEGPVARNALQAGIRLRRRRRVQGIAGTAAVAAVLAITAPAVAGAFSGTPAAPAPQPVSQGAAGGFVALPTSSWRPQDPAMQALLTGTLTGGTVSSGQYCVWIVSRTGGKVPVVWPAGFKARAQPLEVTNAAGAVFARAGQKIGLTGGSGRAAPGNACMLGASNAFYVQAEQPVLFPQHRG